MTMPFYVKTYMPSETESQISILQTTSSQASIPTKRSELPPTPHERRSRKVRWIIGITIFVIIAIGIGSGLGVGLSLTRENDNDNDTLSIYANTSLAAVNWTDSNHQQFRLFFQDTKNRLWEAAANRSLGGDIDGNWTVSRITNVRFFPKGGSPLAATVVRNSRNGAESIQYRLYYVDSRNMLREIDRNPAENTWTQRRPWFRILHPQSNIAAFHLEEPSPEICDGACDMILYQEPGKNLRYVVLPEQGDRRVRTFIPNFTVNTTGGEGPEAEDGSALALTRWTINGTDRLYLFYTPVNSISPNAHFMTYADLESTDLTWSDPNVYLRFSSSNPTRSIAPLILPDNTTSQTGGGLLLLSPGYYTSLVMWYADEVPEDSVEGGDKTFTYDISKLSESTTSQARSAISYDIATNQAGRFYAVREDGIHQYISTETRRAAICSSDRTLGCTNIDAPKVQQVCQDASYYC